LLLLLRRLWLLLGPILLRLVLQALVLAQGRVPELVPELMLEPAL